MNSLIYIYGSSPFQAGTEREVIQWRCLIAAVLACSTWCASGVIAAVNGGLSASLPRNDALLKDMGISRGQAIREAAKPFWRR